MVKNLPANEDVGSNPGSGRAPGEGNGTPLQYSCLENPMDRGGWWATVHVVTLSKKYFLLLYDLILANYIYNNPTAN